MHLENLWKGGFCNVVKAHAICTDILPFCMIFDEFVQTEHLCLKTIQIIKY